MKCQLNLNNDSVESFASKAYQESDEEVLALVLLVQKASGLQRHERRSENLRSDETQEVLAHDRRLAAWKLSRNKRISLKLNPHLALFVIHYTRLTRSHHFTKKNDKLNSTLYVVRSVSARNST